MARSVANNRFDYNKILEKYAANGKKQVRLAQSDLFLTRAIEANKNSYTFDVLDNITQGLQPDEIRLNMNDEFISNAFGIFLYGTIADVETPTLTSPFMLTYPPNELGVAANLMGGLYAGTLKMGVNNIFYMEKWALRKHLFIPRTQFASYHPVASPTPLLGQGNFPATIPSLDYLNDGMVAMAPTFTLSGAAKNEITISLPSAITPGSFQFTDQSGAQLAITIDRIAARFMGLLAQNAAAFQQ